jgi:hypothetical protein
VFPRDVVCLRNISVDTLQKGDTDDDDDNDDDDDDDDDNNNNNNNNVSLYDIDLKWYFSHVQFTRVVCFKHLFSLRNGKYVH